MILQLGTITCIHGDCMDYMKDLPDKAYNLSIVDPEYGIGAGKKKQYHKNSFTKYISKNWDNSIPDKIFFDELFRVSVNQIIWGANYFTEFIPPKKNWIVWDKLQPDGISLSMHELAFYSGDGQAKIYKGYNGANRCVVKEKARAYTRIHPTQKPVPLYKWLLTNYAKPGDKILDTHGGSFSHAIAAHDLGFELTIIEKDKDYFDAAVKRLKTHQRQLKLF